MENTLKTALTFNDVLLRPRYAGFLRSDINLSVQLTPRIRLTAPLVSSPMDTVTESELAIELARQGGLGIIHRNLTIADQAAEVKKVKKQNLLVGAAVGSSAGFEERVKALVEAGVDVLLVDSAHGHSLKVITTLTYIKKNYDIDVIAGNVATEEGARALINAGADALRVGMGPGAICTTRIVSGMGVPQLTALMETARVAQRHNVPIIADGGLIHSGDVVKALAAGASCVMFGRMFAACQESPGKVVMLKPQEVPARFRSIIDGRQTEYCFKEYRAMGSIAAMQQGIKVSSEDEFHGKNFQSDVLIAEGVEGLVPCTTTVKGLVEQMIGGVTSGMYYVGAKTIAELWEAQFMQITQASLSESHPHDLFITNPGDNYS